jgi:hypothetical protein
LPVRTNGVPLLKQSRLDSGQRADGVVRLELDIHVFAVAGVRPDGHLNCLNHTLVTLEFEEVEALELDGFGNQNVLFDLKLEDVTSPLAARSRLGYRRATALAGASVAAQ